MLLRPHLCRLKHALALPEVKLMLQFLGSFPNIHSLSTSHFIAMSDDSFHHRRISRSVTSQLLLCLSPQWMWKVPHTQWRVSFFQKRLWGLGVLSIHALRGSVRVVVARRGHTKLPALLSLTHRGWRLFETEYPTWVFDIWEQWQIQRPDLHHWFLWCVPLDRFQISTRICFR